MALSDKNSPHIKIHSYPLCLKTNEGLLKYFKNIILTE